MKNQNTSAIKRPVRYTSSDPNLFAFAIYSDANGNILAPEQICAALNAGLASEWVAVHNERDLPQKEGLYVGLLKNGYCEIFWANEYQDKWLQGQKYLAWMPIPPYEPAAGEQA